MRKLDFHYHFDSDKISDVEKVVACAKNLNTMITVVGGLRYGHENYVPNEDVLNFCKKNSDWLIPMAKFDLWDQVDANLIYQYKDMGFKAIKFLYPYYEYDHDIYMPVYAACEKCGLPVLFHTGDYRPKPQADRVWQRPILKNMHPINLDRIARAFPDLKIVMAHMGTAFFRDLAANLIQMLPNLYFDLAGCGAWIGVTPEKLREMLMPFPNFFRGNDQYRYFRKLIFGSDGYTSNTWPLTEGIGYYERSLDENMVPDDIRSGIMGQTAAQWMGIDL